MNKTNLIILAVSIAAGYFAAQKLATKQPWQKAYMLGAGV